METENKTIRELTRIYLDSCKDVAIEALKVSKNKRKAFVHEAIADHEWVIISYYSRLVGVLSDNVHAYQDSAEYQEK